MTTRLPPAHRAAFPPLAGPATGPPYVRVLSAGHLVGRIFMKGGDHSTSWNAFRHFGPTANRFDHHPPPRRGHPVRAVQYAAPLWEMTSTGGAVRAAPVLQVCLAEVYRSTGTVDLSLGEPWFVQYRLARPTSLLDLSDSDWVTHAGGNAAISSGGHARAREWSRAVYGHYAVAQSGALDGLIYQSSNVPRARSLMFYETGESALPASPDVEVPLSHPVLRGDVERMCREMDLALVLP